MDVGMDPRKQVTLVVAATARHLHLLAGRLAEKMEDTVLGMEGLGATSKDASISMRGNGGSSSCSSCHCLCLAFLCSFG